MKLDNRLIGGGGGSSGGEGNLSRRLQAYQSSYSVPLFPRGIKITELIEESSFRVGGDSSTRPVLHSANRQATTNESNIINYNSNRIKPHNSGGGGEEEEEGG